MSAPTAAGKPVWLHPASGTPPALRIGRGSAFGAVSILNATATGIGCSLAVAGGVQAEWQWRAGGLQAETPGADGRLAQAVWQRLRGMVAQGAMDGAIVRTEAAFPPSRGLKTSSAAAGAMVRAAYDGLGRDVDWMAVAHDAVEASLAAGVTVTGAFDDQVAVLKGGAHVTDNRLRRILHSFAVPPWHVAVWVPEASVPKSRIARLDASVLRPMLEPTVQRLAAGGGTMADARAVLPSVLTASGRVYHQFYASHGLPVDDGPVQVALGRGALGAGLSGTGPAVAALFDDAVDLPPCPGGTWRWTRAVDVRP